MCYITLLGEKKGESKKKKKVQKHFIAVWLSSFSSLLMKFMKLRFTIKIFHVSNIFLLLTQSSFYIFLPFNGYFQTLSYKYSNCNIYTFQYFPFFAPPPLIFLKSMFSAKINLSNLLGWKKYRKKFYDSKYTIYAIRSKCM